MNEPIRCPKCDSQFITLFGERWMNGMCSKASCAKCRWSGAVQIVPIKQPAKEDK